MCICVFHFIQPRKRRNQHKQRRFWQMKIRQQHINRTKFITRCNKNIGTAANWRNASVTHGFRQITVVHCRTFQRTHGCCANRNYTFCIVDYVGLLRRDATPFTVHFMFIQIFGFNRHPCTRPNMQCYFYYSCATAFYFIH